MAHEIEHRADRDTDSFAFVGERSAIWHRLGQPMREGASTAEWMAASNQDYRVRKVAIAGVAGGEGDGIEWDADMLLIREDSGRPLGIVSADWTPAQNEDAYTFLTPFVDAGFCSINTAGVLYDGKRAFVLAKTKEGFQLPGGDENEGYMLVQISHEYGVADLVLPTSVRVVCANTLQLALRSKSNSQMEAGKFVHRAKTAFSVEKAHAVIDAYRRGLGEYAEKAKFLTTKKATPEQTRAYVNKVFNLQELTKGTPAEVAHRKEHNERVVQKLLQTVQTQPGATMSEGSWWTNFNAVTFWEDHGRWAAVGRDEPVKFDGTSADRKQTAFKVALEMAVAA